MHVMVLCYKMTNLKGKQRMKNLKDKRILMKMKRLQCDGHDYFKKSRSNASKFPIKDTLTTRYN